MSTIRQKAYRIFCGLQFRTTVLLTGIVLSATGMTGAMYLRMSTQLLSAESQSSTRDLAHALAVSSVDAVAEEDREKLTSIASQAILESDLDYVIFTDVTGTMLASFQKGAGLINHLFLGGAGRVSVDPLDKPDTVFIPNHGRVVDVVLPVRKRNGQHDPASPGYTVGYVRLGMNLRTAESRLKALVRGVAGLAVGIALLMLPIGYQVVRYVASPIQNLSEAAKQFAKGALEARVQICRNDEIGELAESFNGMADEIARSQNQLVKLNAELEDRVLQRTTALENANRLLREMASRDSLTGLYNRRHFNELLAQLFAESTRYGTELTCMMIDLDNFKQVNDSLGHQTGDRLLQLTADIISGTIRESDIAVRYGGDEFAVLLPQTAPNEARHSATRILEAFRDRIARELPEANIASLSIGLVSREKNQPAAAHELVNLADEALYLAKAGGKNRITVARPAGAVA